MTVPTNHSFSAQERTAAKALISGHSDWQSYRAVALSGKDTGQLLVPEIIQALNDLKITTGDIAAHLNANPVTITPTTPAGAPAGAPITTPAADTPATADTPASVKDALNDVSAFIHPDMLNALEAKLAPVFAAAAKPAAAPQIIYRGERKSVNPDGSAPATRQGTERLGALFGLRGKHTDFPCTIWDSAAAPSIDPHYMFDKDSLFPLMECIESGGYAWLAGHSSTGKTTLPQEIAARTKRPFFRFSMDKTTELSEYMGQRLPDENMKLVWTDAAFLQAWETPSAIILIDEITMLQAGSAAKLSTCLDERCITVPDTGEVRYAADGVTVIAADNTNGTGDATNLYGGTNEASLALRDRFDICLHMDYLPVAKETALLTNKTGLPDKAAKALCAFASIQRKGVQDGDIDAPITFRRLTSWAKRLVAGIPCERAFEIALLNSMSPDDCLAVDALAKLHLNHADIDIHTAGQSLPDTQDGTPAGEQTTPAGLAAASDFASA